MRHPIKTLRGLIAMGAKDCSLTLEEAKKLVEDYEYLWGQVEAEGHLGSDIDRFRFGLTDDEQGG